VGTVAADENVKNPIGKAKKEALRLRLSRKRSRKKKDTLRNLKKVWEIQKESILNLHLLGKTQGQETPLRKGGKLNVFDTNTQSRGSFRKKRGQGNWPNE